MPDRINESILAFRQFGIMESDQVTENFGVRFGCKVYPFVGKEPFQGAKIFDNTVMNQNELFIVAQMRMSVGDGYRTVSGPSGMSDTKGCG